MRLQDLAKKPQLIKITLDDQDLVTEFGEAIEFYTWDRQPMDVFMKLANVNPDNAGSVIEAVKQLVLDETGQPIITADTMLPTKIMMRVLTRVVESLGK
jgi:hypothetical protein